MKHTPVNMNKKVYYINIVNHRDIKVGYYKTNYEITGAGVQLSNKHDNGDEVGWLEIKKQEQYPQTIYTRYLKIGKHINKKRLQQLAKENPNIITLFY